MSMKRIPEEESPGCVFLKCDCCNQIIALLLFPVYKNRSDDFYKQAVCPTCHGCGLIMGKRVKLPASVMKRLVIGLWEGF